MELYSLTAPCHFGLEAVLKKEIYDMGYDITRVDDGRVTFEGDAEAIARANIFSRSAERILVECAAFKAESFEELYDKTRALDWSRFIPQNGKFWITKASSVKSKLHSPSDIQSIMKKAMVDSLKESYHTGSLLEDGAEYPFRVFIKKDMVTIGLDTTGESLHKRGYRKLTAKAPIAENLAAALISLTPWNKDRVLADPFCGSGTFPIEAALMAANIAPGMKRRFRAQTWENLMAKKLWKDVFDEAKDLVDLSCHPDITGTDIDPSMIDIAKQNAKLAGVDKLISFRQCDVAQFSHPASYGFMITNPPYGERLMGEEDVRPLYDSLRKTFNSLDKWSLYVITSYEGTQTALKKKAAKNRKLYNGMIKTYFYMFPGERPAKDHSE